jgi:hypothetical protein
VRSTNIIQASTPNVAAFHARLNQAEVIVEHIGNKSNNKNTDEIKRSPLIEFKSLVKPYKYMYQTIYKRANGWYHSIWIEYKNFKILFFIIFST